MNDQTRRGNDDEPKWKNYGAKKRTMPLFGYGALIGTYTIGLGALLRWSGGRRRLSRFTSRIGIGEIALFGLATHKLGRIIAKDFVTSPLRAPFVAYEDSGIAGEVSEQSRGTGIRRAIGDLITCEYCLAPWVAASLFAFRVVDPRGARLIASLFASVAVSDFVNRAYLAASKRSEAAGQAPNRGLPRGAGSSDRIPARTNE